MADGGSPITQYIIEKLDATRPGASWVVAGTVEASVLSYKVTKLFQGNAYLLRVAAENRVGMSLPIELDHPVIAKLPFGECSLNLITLSLLSCPLVSVFLA